MTRHLSARARLTLLYTSLFAAGGAVLISVTYVLLDHFLTVNPQSFGKPTIASDAIARCVASLTGKGGISSSVAKAKCSSAYVAGADAQRQPTLDHLLLYSLTALFAVTLLAAVAGWFVSGRILRPVHLITAAARAAGERDLSQRINYQGSRDELRELADTFDDMLARLDRAFTAQRQFIANAGHELRTPLTVMRTSVDVVLGKPDPTRAELAAMGVDVRHEVTHTERLIDALLMLARSERPLHAEPLDLAAFVEDAVYERAAAGVSWETSLAPAPVSGDALLLERLVVNLLDNATRYNVPAGTVAVATGTDTAGAFLRVRNTGPVVTGEDVSRLFLPFTRLADRTTQDGSGLGLALVASIAAQHGGTVDAQAQTTGGLMVTVRLPLRAAQPAEVRSPRQTISP
jgi:signal transduction histidine kinase